MIMNKTEYLKNAKMFLKMSEMDLTVLKIVKLTKILLSGALFVNTAAFAVMMFFGIKKAK